MQDCAGAGRMLAKLSADFAESVLCQIGWCAAAKACADDISKYCNVTWFAGLNPGSVLACLKDARSQLRPACQKEVFKLQLDAAEDYRYGPVGCSNVMHKVSQGKQAG
jgi:hypothetical protein